MIINGLLGDSLNANDRGLMYGDGVFRTLRISQGKPLLWPQHYNKLQHDCAALAFECPAIKALEDELMQLIQPDTNGIAKIIITRGPSSRGYMPTVNPQVSRILSLSPLPEYPATYAKQGIKVHVCNLRLAHQPRLAGIKHLNRLENVLAAAECSAPDIAEGILLDMENHVIEGTRSNLFWVQNGKLYTSDLSQCGVAGLQRDRVIEYAQQQGWACAIGNFKLSELFAADEIFVVNSLIGLWLTHGIPSH